MFTPYHVQNFASLRASVAGSMMKKYLEDELLKMTEDPEKKQPSVSLVGDELVMGLVAELVYAKVLNGGVGRDAVTDLAMVNRLSIGYHQREIDGLAAMNDRLGKVGS